MEFLKKFSNWYFSRRSLPYWAILSMDILICYLSGIYVTWLYWNGTRILGSIIPLLTTLSLYMVFNVIAFKIFHTYSGIIRYSSFIDLKKVGYAMGLALILAMIFHYVLYYADTYFLVHFGLRFAHFQGRQIIIIYLLATLLMWACRVLIKSVYDASFANDGASKTLIYGVRDGGISLAKNIINEKPTRYLLKGFISHNPAYKARLLMGERVYPVDEHLKDVIVREGIKTVLVSPIQNDRFRHDTKLQDLLIEHFDVARNERMDSKWNSKRFKAC